MKEILLEFLKVCPIIEWDRYIKDEDGYQCYGWIPRSDGKRDFILCAFKDGDTFSDAGYTTSSAKYSKLFCEASGGIHSDCIKIEL